MSGLNQQATEHSLESIITASVKVPGVKVNRTAFLTETFENEVDDLQAIIDNGPIAYGISREKLSSIANNLILIRTSQSSITSFIAGIPGGLAMAATIPLDVMQYFGMALKLAQELSYLYGADDLWQNGAIDENRVRSQLILYCGVMFGVSGAACGVRVLSSQIAKTTLKKLPQKALTKTFWYPIVKKICNAVGVNITKKTVSQGISKAIPVIGGVISGAINFASMMPMAKRLYVALDDASFDYTEEEFEADILEIENASEQSSDSEEKSKADFSEIGSAVSKGIKNIGSGVTGLFSKKDKSVVEIDNFEKIKKLKELFDIGAITQEEFESKKKELLD